MWRYNMGSFGKLCRGSFFEEVCRLKWKCVFFCFVDIAPAVEKKLETRQWIYI